MIRKLSRENQYRIFLVLISLLVFIPFNGLVHLFDWDEINFAESAREMIVSGNYHTVTINFTPFWEKPPLFIWMQVLSMKIFGINEFAARFPDAICGMLSLLLLFEVGRELRNSKFGLIWALAFGASVLPFLYFKSGIIDPWFNLFIFSSLYFAFRHFSRNDAGHKNRTNLMLSAGLLGLAVLTKGPVAILLFGMSFLIYLISERKLRLIKGTDLLIFTVILILTGGAYHLYQIFTGNWKLVHDFFVYQVRLMKTEDAGHGGSIFYHPIVLFIGVFPTSILALRTFFKKSTVNNDYRKLMIALFLVVLVIFSLVKTKIVHYSSLCYFPLSYLAAQAVYEISSGEQKLSRLSKILLAGVGFIFAAAPGAVQYIATAVSPEVLKKYIKDDFAIDCIQTTVHWAGYEFLTGVVFGILLLFAVVYLRGLRQIVTIYVGTAVFVFMLMFILVPKIEQYSQGPAIGFISSFKDKAVWISTLGYKSYAPYFYSDKPERACASDDEQAFLLHGDTGRDVYFVVKSTSLQSILKQYPNLAFVKKNGGFVLLKRMNPPLLK